MNFIIIIRDAPDVRPSGYSGLFLYPISHNPVYVQRYRYHQAPALLGVAQN
jgi:hypothetical protein